MFRALENLIKEDSGKKPDVGTGIAISMVAFGLAVASVKGCEDIKASENFSNAYDSITMSPHERTQKYVLNDLREELNPDYLRAYENHIPSK